jgi:hypothetical protein
MFHILVLAVDVKSNVALEPKAASAGHVLFKGLQLVFWQILALEFLERERIPYPCLSYCLGQKREAGQRKESEPRSHRCDNKKQKLIEYGAAGVKEWNYRARKSSCNE